MAFNPIHLAESDFLTVDPSLRDASFAPPAAGANATTGANNLSMERFCKTSYFFDLPWEIPFPRQPTAPLLYFPEAYKNLSTSPAEVGVMDCEVDAMADGVLSRIPLAYYPLQQRSVQAAYNAAAATEQRIADMQRQATASGQLERLTWKAVDVNPAIDPADAELLDTDIDASMVQQRDAPSLTLMQRPLYTDMGLVPQEQRHAARLARIVPSHLRSLSQAAAADLPGSPASPINGAGGASPFDLAGSQDQSDAAEWPTQVSRSFKHAKGLDRQFDDFIEELVRTKLGLNKASADHCDIARAMWRALFEGSSVEQQTTVWSAICIFSMNYSEIAETNEAAAKELQRMISGARLPNYMTTWRPLIRRYVESLAAHVATLRGGVAERQAALELAIELDATSFSVPPFHAYFDGKRMLRRQGTELGKDNLPLRLYPLEVLPIFPSGFREAAESTGISLQASQQGTLDFLAERTCELRHVVLPGAPTHVSPTGPHVLVSGTNLLVAETEEDSTAGHRKSNASEEGCAPVLAEGATVAYHSAKEGTYESLYQDDENTASYLMRVCRDQSAQGRGSTNPDGLCVVFDRIGTKNVFVKAPQSSREMPTTKYVLLYSDAEPTVDVHEEGELAHGVKRERSPSLENTEESSVRVKRETE